MNTTSIHAEMPLTHYSAYDVTIDNEIVHVVAKSRSAAKYKAFNGLEMGEYITYEEFINNKSFDVKTHCTGHAKLKDLFMNDDSLDFCRNRRQLTWLKLGMKIDWCDQTAYIVGGSDILIFYLLDEDVIARDHPTWRMTYYDDHDHIITSYNA